METALMAFQARLQARALAQGAPVLKSSAALIQDRPLACRIAITASGRRLLFSYPRHA